MKELIKVIAFDADDTLWSNEPFFQDIEKQYTDLLKSYGTPEDISAALFQTEMNNLKCLGYGAKAFTISMVETALRVSGRKISATDIQHIIELGKSLLKMPIELLPGVKETLKTLKKTGKYKLVVATKGDLLDQENKLERSGLAPYFDHIEVMSDKTEKEYHVEHTANYPFGTCHGWQFPEIRYSTCPIFRRIRSTYSFRSNVEA